MRLHRQSLTGGGVGGGGTPADEIPIAATFGPQDNAPPAASFAYLDTRNSVQVLTFVETSETYSVFQGRVNPDVDITGGFSVRAVCMAATATSGNYVIAAQIERMNTDLDADSWGTEVAATVAAPGTSGEPKVTTLAFTTAGETDGLLAGESFRLRFYRKALDGADNMSGNLQLIEVGLEPVE